MKKYLLGLLVVGLSFFSFSSADFLTSNENIGTITCINSWGTCSLLSIPGNSSIIVEGDFNYLVLKCDQSIIFNIYPGVSFTTPDCNNLKLETYMNKSGQVPFSVKLYKVNDYKVVLSPVINGLSDTITEYLPYLMYISLGILGVVFGFFAIKWLMDWIRAKILSLFK